MNIDRQNFCKSLIKSGIKLILDENTNSDNPARCIGREGKAIGYYSILLDYDINTDSFLVGYKKHVPSAHVYDIFAYDASKMTEARLARINSKN